MSLSTNWDERAWMISPSSRIRRRVSEITTGVASSRGYTTRSRSCARSAWIIGASPTFCPKPSEKAPRRNLPRRGVEALLHGRHASIGGRTVAKRSRHLAVIAAAYTWDELLSEPGVGSVTANQIRLWLEERGGTLRYRTAGPQSYDTE